MGLGLYLGWHFPQGLLTPIAARSERGEGEKRFYGGGKDERRRAAF